MATLPRVAALLAAVLWYLADERHGELFDVFAATDGSVEHLAQEDDGQRDE